MSTSFWRFFSLFFKAMYNKYEKLLTEHGISTNKVAKATGIDKSFFSKWKAGKFQPKIDKLQKIADFFGIPVTYFYEDTPVAKAFEEHKTSIDYQFDTLNAYDKIKLALNSCPDLKDVEFTDNQIDKIIEYAQFITR